MKFLIASDVHGSASAFEKVMAQFEKTNCDKMILLGDILYHGPRNPLAERYSPMNVSDMLNSISDKVIACRGNCDSEVDQMVLNFPIQSDYTLVVDEGVRIFASHGHIFSPPSEESDFSKKNIFPVVAGSNLPPTEIDLALFGHIHVQKLYKTNLISGHEIIVCNPGSTTLPKENSSAGFAIYENKKISLHNLEGNVLQELSF